MLPYEGTRECAEDIITTSLFAAAILVRTSLFATMATYMLVVLLCSGTKIMSDATCIGHAMVKWVPLVRTDPASTIDAAGHLVVMLYVLEH